MYARLRGEQNGNSRLTSEEVVRIKELLSCGLTQREIAARYKVTRTTISLIKRGLRWAHVEGPEQ